MQSKVRTQPILLCVTTVLSDLKGFSPVTLDEVALHHGLCHARSEEETSWCTSVLPLCLCLHKSIFCSS